MTRKKIAALFAVGTLVLFGGAQTGLAAQGQIPQHIQDRFNQMDANKDGKVVLEEFRASFPNMNEKAFTMIDVNGDGGIEQAEWYDFMDRHSRDSMRPKERDGMGMNNIPGDPLIPPIDSNDLPLMRPPNM